MLSGTPRSGKVIAAKGLKISHRLGRLAQKSKWPDLTEPDQPSAVPYVCPRSAPDAQIAQSEGMKGLIIGPASVAIVWAASIAIVWAFLTMQPARPDAFAGVDRHHFGQLRFFPLR